MRKASIFTQNVDMTREAVLKQMMLFALPLIFTNLLQQLYNIADSAVVGRFDSALSLAAVGTAGMIVGVAQRLPDGFCKRRQHCCRPIFWCIRWEKFRKINSYHLCAFHHHRGNPLCTGACAVARTADRHPCAG